VIDSEIKDGPKGNYIDWTYEIVGKPNRIWDVMSLSNSVSMSRLKSLAVACGLHNPNFIADTEELHGREFMVRLKIEEDENGQYEPKNKATAFKAVEESCVKPVSFQQPRIDAHIASSKTSTQSQQPRMPWEK